MPDLPKKRTIKTTRHEWVIGVDSEPTDAKNFRFGLHTAYEEMSKLGVNLEFDDSFHVRAGEGGEVILFIDVERDSKTDS
jgi:hypothetical protein